MFDNFGTKKQGCCLLKNYYMTLKWQNDLAFLGVQNLNAVVQISDIKYHLKSKQAKVRISDVQISDIHCTSKYFMR